MNVRKLDLDLDAFEGPFDLLLTLVLREELPLAEVDVAGIVLAFVERLAEREELDLDACGEFLVLVAALLELKARGVRRRGGARAPERRPGARSAARGTGGSRAPQSGGRARADGDRFFRLGRLVGAARSAAGAGSGGPQLCCRRWRPATEVSLAHLEYFRRSRGSSSSSGPCWGGVSGSISTTRSRG
jgi:hypothetical protein